MSEGNDSKRREFSETALVHMDALYTSAVYLCRDRDEAADLLQETLLRAYRSWHQFTPGSNCKAWLLTILHNAFRNFHRARKSRPPAVELDEALLGSDGSADGPAELRDPADLVTSQSMDGEVQAALDGLPEDYRAAVVLVDLQELTYEEAAAVVGCPVGTIRSRLSRARQMLYRALESYANQKRLLRSG